MSCNRADRSGWPNRQGELVLLSRGPCEDRQIIFDMVDIPGEHNYRPNQGAITKDTLPFTAWIRRHGIPWRKPSLMRRSPAAFPHRVRVGPAMGRARATVHESKISTRLIGDLAEFVREAVSAAKASRDARFRCSRLPIPTVPENAKKVISADVPPTRVGSQGAPWNRRRIDSIPRHHPIPWQRGSSEKRFVKICLRVIPMALPTAVFDSTETATT